MIDFVKELAVASGSMCLEEFERSSSLTMEFKNEKDIVTAADKKIENFIRKTVEAKFPGHDFFGEETGRSSKGSEYCWVVDPIDGTTSFVHGQPFFSVSIALQKNNETVFAAVNAPRLGELFLAEKGAGAFVNGKKMAVSKRDKLVNCVFSTGFACLRAGLKDNNLKYFNRIVPELRGIRRYGSAAIDMAFVAAGRLDGFWEMQLNLYDIAAGILLVKEAGGNVCDFQGGRNYPLKGTVTTNGLVDGQFLPLLKD